MNKEKVKICRALLNKIVELKEEERLYNEPRCPNELSGLIFHKLSNELDFASSGILLLKNATLATDDLDLFIATINEYLAIFESVESGG